MKFPLTGSTLFGMWIGISAGNYLYQAANQELWMRAFERSYFQGAALFCVWLTLKLTAEKET
jgi:hypothetical protein